MSIILMRAFRNLTILIRYVRPRWRVQFTRLQRKKNSEPSFPWIVRWQQLKVLVSEIPWRLIGARCKYRRSLDKQSTEPVVSR